ncbi:MAG: hypothetical protein ABIP51_20430 [Bacteroidia bacterium]
MEKIRVAKTQVIEIGDKLQVAVLQLDASPEMEQPSTDSYLKIEAPKEIASAKPKKEEENYIPVDCAFLDAIREQTDNCHNQEALNNCINIHMDVSAYWVGQRLRCLIECLLVLSEAKYAKVADLMEICNAFTHITRSVHYKSLPTIFPYTDDIPLLRDKLKQVCLKIQKADEIKFRLDKEDKIQLIATRYELAQYISKKKFSQLEFSYK